MVGCAGAAWTALSGRPGRAVRRVRPLVVAARIFSALEEHRNETNANDLMRE